MHNLLKKLDTGIKLHYSIGRWIGGVGVQRHGLTLI